MASASGHTGIVRGPRRPPGWRPPGPAPAQRPPLGAWPGPGEDLCFLAGDWRILQRRDGHRWSLDDLLTAWFATREPTAAPPTRFVDLGCGIGSVLLLLAWRFPGATGVGIEAQPLSVDLARRSIARNGAAPRCEVRLGDLRDEAILGAGEAFDLVTGTPPYLPPGTGLESPRPQRGPCRLELRGGIEDYCAAAARALAPGGRFVACESARQGERVERAAGLAGLAVVRRRDVVPRAGKAPLFTLFSLARRGEADASAAPVESALVVRDAEGRRTADYVAARTEMGLPP